MKHLLTQMWYGRPGKMIFFCIAKHTSFGLCSVHAKHMANKSQVGKTENQATLKNFRQALNWVWQQGRQLCYSLRKTGMEYVLHKKQGPKKEHLMSKACPNYIVGSVKDIRENLAFWYFLGHPSYYNTPILLQVVRAFDIALLLDSTVLSLFNEEAKYLFFE